MLRKTALILLFVSLVASGSSATTYYVSTGGSDGNNGLSESSAFRTPNKGESMAQAGDSVVFLPDTFYCASGGQLVTGTRNGQPGDSIYFVGHPDFLPKRPVFVGGPTWGTVAESHSYQAVQLSGNYKVLDNLEVAWSFGGLRVTNFHHVTIRNCYVHNCTTEGSNNNGSGIFVGYESAGGTNLRIENCTLRDGYDFPVGTHTQQSSGVHVYACTNLVIQDCYISGFQPAGNGVFLKWLNQAPLIVQRNRIENCDMGVAVASTASGVYIHHNVIWNCGSAGVNIRPGVDPVEDVWIYNNTIYDVQYQNFNTYPYLTIDQVNLFNNIIFDPSQQAALMRTEDASKILSAFIDYNCWYNGANDIILWDNQANSGDWSLADFRSATPYADHSIQTSPNLASPGSGDFLMTGSTPSQVRTGGRGGTWPTYMGAYSPTGQDGPGDGDPPPDGDYIPPQFSNVQHNEIGPGRLEVRWNTNEPATTRVAYGTTTAVGDSTSLKGTFVTTHFDTINGLSAGTVYYRLISTDTAGNTGSVGPYQAQMTAGDGQPPVITSVGDEAIDANTVMISWQTNEPATTRIAYGLSASVPDTTDEKTVFTLSHVDTLVGLQGGHVYFYKVISTDTAGNTAVRGTYQTLSTSLQNHTLNVTPTVDGTYPGYTLSSVTDGTVIPAVYNENSTWASDDGAGTPHWVEFDFGSDKTVRSFVVYWGWNPYTSSWMTSQEYYLQRWTGSAWEDLAHVTTADSGKVRSTTTVLSSSIVASRVRVYQTANQGPTDYSAVIWLTELQVFNAYPPIQPVTDLGAVPGESNGEITLSWTAPGESGEQADVYVVKYSTDPLDESTWAGLPVFDSPPSPSPAGTSETLVLDGLTPGALYYAGIKAIDVEGNASSLSLVGSAVARFEISSGDGDCPLFFEAPDEGATVADVRPTLSVGNINLSDTNVYFFQVATDSAFTENVVNSYTVNQQAGFSTSWQVTQDLEYGNTYFWRATANAFPFCEAQTFVTPAVPSATSPEPHAYPNPFNLAQSGTTTFTGLPENANLLVTTVSGMNVRRFTDVVGGEVIWDGRNESGSEVATGVYLWYVENSEQHGKLIVLRN